MKKAAFHLTLTALAEICQARGLTLRIDGSGHVDARVQLDRQVETICLGQPANYAAEAIGYALELVGGPIVPPMVRRPMSEAGAAATAPASIV